jgi:hypothetical protein
VRGTLMIDDPLSLLSLGIWLMAAGMWPVGFLFGACSACCDECPPECNKCSQAYDSTDVSGCKEAPESVVITSEYDSRSYTSSTASVAGSLVADGLQHLQITEAYDCSGTEVYLSLIPENWFSDAPRDDCDCLTCRYRISYQLGIAERGVFGGQPFDSAIAPGRTPMPDVFLNYDKCAQSSKTVQIPVTNAQILEALGSQGYDDIECIDGMKALEDFTVELQFNLGEGECDCGACCRESGCTDNELQTYCEQNTATFGDLGNGIWAGVGTSCDDDPDPCAEE